VTTPSTHRLYSWATETRLSGSVSPQDIALAAQQFRAAGGGQAWLLDASNATWLEPGAFDAIEREVRALAPSGLGWIAVVLPWIAHGYIPQVMERLRPVVVKGVGSRNEAVAWLKGGCK
jgi:hypothetical protein